MEFKKKLKIRFYTAVSYLLIGLAMMVVGLWKGVEVASSFGLMFLIIGIARIRQAQTNHCNRRKYAKTGDSRNR